MLVKEWLINWFEKNSDLNLDEIVNNVNEDYLAKGWIDSFKFISFITEIESKFKITFSNEEFQNMDFSTIEGLAGIIEAKIEK